MSRPEGSINVEAVVVTHATRCRYCDSTARLPYGNPKTVACVTTLANGTPVTHFVDRNTRCTNCQMPRIDRTFYNLAPGLTPVIPEDTGGVKITPLSDQTTRPQKKKNGRRNRKAPSTVV